MRRALPALLLGLILLPWGTRAEAQRPDRDPGSRRWDHLGPRHAFVTWPPPGVGPLPGRYFPHTMPTVGPRPWKPRLRQGVEPRGRGLRDITRWPDEPPTPSPVDPARLTSALGQLSTRALPRRYLANLAGWITRYAKEFDVDPFLIGALIQDQSHFRARKHSDYGVGLLAIQPSMHRSRIRGGRYRYAVLENGVWQPRYVEVSRFHFSAETLHNPEANIYFGAAILRVFREQCPDIDHYFRSVPHRHYVSHFLWGDPVRGAGMEDRVLRERRRLITYYLGVPPFPRGRFRSLLLHAPLDGAPRKVTSVLGDDRDGGRRHHTGIDFASERGEPVRAIAPGQVILAGVDWGNNQLRNLEPSVARVLPHVSLGPRGLLVMIQHRDGLASTYMHLSAYTVRAGDRVKARQVVGYVGRTGIKESPAHLHFDMRYQGRFIDPMVYLKPYVIPPDATYVGLRKEAVQRYRRLLRFKAHRRAILRRLRERHHGLGQHAGPPRRRPRRHHGMESYAPSRPSRSSLR